MNIKHTENCMQAKPWC